MKEKLLLETAISEGRVNLYHFNEETQESTLVDPSNTEEGAKLFGCSKDLIGALVYLCEQINDMRDFAERDLTYLYKEIKALKEK